MKVFEEIDDSIKKINTYIEEKNPKRVMLEKANAILVHPFKIMGLFYGQSEGSSGNREEKVLTSITEFRANIKNNCKDFKKILELCDDFRDREMVEVGIKIQDGNVGEPSKWKYSSKE